LKKNSYYYNPFLITDHNKNNSVQTSQRAKLLTEHVKLKENYKHEQ